MSFFTPTLLANGPVILEDKTSVKFKDPTLTNLAFQIRLVVIVVKISVRVLKQSLPNKATSKKNW